MNKKFYCIAIMVSSLFTCQMHGSVKKRFIADSYGVDSSPKSVVDCNIKNQWPFISSIPVSPEDQEVADIINNGKKQVFLALASCQDRSAYLDNLARAVILEQSCTQKIGKLDDLLLLSSLYEKSYQLKMWEAFYPKVIKRNCPPCISKSIEDRINELRGK